MTSVREEISYRLARFAVSILLAMAFLIASIIGPPLLRGINQNSEFLVWIITIIVTGMFLVRALLDALVLGDKAIGPFLKRLGIKEEWSRKRVLKDLTYIVAILLAAAAISPFFSTMKNVGVVMQTITTYIVLGLILLFVYDIGRTFYRITEEKANLVADWLVPPRNEEGEMSGE